MKSFGLGKMTLTSIFHKPETHMYPFEPMPEVLGRRGTVAIDIERCVFCGACARNCPADAIDVDRKGQTWSINHFSCVQCASCVDTCPKHCLRMAEEVPAVGTASTAEIVQKIGE